VTSPFTFFGGGGVGRLQTPPIDATVKLKFGEKNLASLTGL